MNNLSWVFLAVVIHISLTLCGSQSSVNGIDLSHRPSPQQAQIIRAKLDELTRNGKNTDMLVYLNGIEEKYGHLHIDDQLPSLYNFRGVAQHNAQMTDASASSFLMAVDYNPDDFRSWINLGEARCHQFRMNDAIYAFSQALSRGKDQAVSVVSRLLRAKGWADSWEDFETISHLAQKFAVECVNTEGCAGEGSGGLEYTDTPGNVQRILHGRSPNAMSSPYKISSHEMGSLWNTKIRRSGVHKVGGVVKVKNRLKVGVVSSDFGVHPVSTLIRGFLQFIDKDEIEMYCFALMPSVSWWGTNITGTVEHFVQIESKNTMDAAQQIAAYKIEILIDLNGHTLHSGLPVMSHRPAPVQISFLGLPTTSGAPFIDYYIGDYVALPAEHRNHFTEKLILTPPTYIVNDYAQMRGGVLENIKENRASRDFLKTDYDISDASILFGTLSNFQKMDPSIFTVWANILRRFPKSKLMTIEYAGYDIAIENLRTQFLPAHGIKKDRVVLAPQAPWVDHIYAKTAIDMILDTSSKNGHTTGLDGIWAGVPSIVLGGGATMPARAAESIAEGFDCTIGVTYSLKEYEDMVYEFAGNRQKLNIWRSHVENQRTLSRLFDTETWTKTFSRLMQATWEAEHVAEAKSKKKSKKSMSREESAGELKFHVFSTRPPNSTRTEELPVYQVYDTGGSVTEVNGALQKMQHRVYLDKAKKKRNKKGKISSMDIRPSKTLDEISVPSEKAAEIMDENSYQKPIPDDILKKDPLLLNIGGTKRIQDWVTVNGQASGYFGYSDEIDVIRAMHDLHGFENASVSAIYSSHTLEHGSFGDGEISDTLKEWRRVMKPGGLVLISVPDLPTLAAAYLDDQLSFNQHWMVTKMMYGAQMDELDFHKVGFDQDVLAYFLHESDFCGIERVGSFNLPFHDTSDMKYGGYTISLNMIARPCDPNNEAEELVGHNAEPYFGPRRVHAAVDKHAV